MRFQLITAQTDWAISLSEAKDHLNVTSNDYDDYILSLIQGAQKMIEESYGLSLTQATYDALIDEFPTDEIDIWLWPISSVTSVKYTDSDGNTQTVDSSNYATDLYSMPARIVPIGGYSWPTVKDTVNAVQIRIVTGFASPETVPADIQLAMKLLIADWYDNREDRGRRFTRVSERILSKYRYGG